MSERKNSPLLLPTLFLILSILTAVVAFYLPALTYPSGDIAVHWRSAASAAPIFLLIGSAIQFLLSYRTFTKAVQSAYRLLAISMLVFSTLFMQVAVWGLFNLWISEWATSGVGLLPLLFASYLIYLSAQKFSRVLQVKSRLQNIWLALASTALIAIGMGILAHYSITYDIDNADLYVGVTAWCSAFLSCAVFLTYKVYRIIGASYQKAMRGLTVSLACLALSAWHEAITTLWYNNGSVYSDYGYQLIPWTIAGLVMLYASYWLRQLGVVPTTNMSEALVSLPVTDQDYIDSVAAVAGLVSQPEEVDPILDDFRIVTAKMSYGQSLSQTSKQQLLSVYLRLETYLMQKDPVRVLRREEILSHATNGFRAEIARQATRKKAT